MASTNDHVLSHTNAAFLSPTNARGVRAHACVQMLFSILRSTEPYLDVYFSEAGNIDAELQEAGFTTVRVTKAALFPPARVNLPTRLNSTMRLLFLEEHVFYCLRVLSPLTVPSPSSCCRTRVLVHQVRKSGVTGRHMAVVGVKGGTFDLRADFKQREKDDTHLQTHKADVWIKTR